MARDAVVFIRALGFHKVTAFTLADMARGALTFRDTTYYLAPATSRTFQVIATDTSGNVSGPSNAITLDR